MPSSKVWRAGRWFWYCHEQNNASDWKDHWACGARSRLTYSTREEAWRAGSQHMRQHDHRIGVQQISPPEQRRGGKRVRKT